MAANTYGRAVVVPLTNKLAASGTVIAGDVVVIDTANNDSFTTDTSGGYTGSVGIVQESIANGAVGRVLVSGYAALVNVNASVTRGQYGKTHTVAKQATGTASRGVGTFCQWLTGGTTPDAVMWPVDLLGSSLTNPMTAVGDIIQGTTAGAPAALAAPLAGKVLTGAGVTTSLAYKYPPGYEFDYVEGPTTGTNVTATTEGTATTIVTSSSITYDGSTKIRIEAGFPDVQPGTTYILLILRDDTAAASIGYLSFQSARVPVMVAREITPASGARVYSIRAFVDAGTGAINAGAGGVGTRMPGYIRITKAA